jgi:hypothetical protein
MSAKRENDFMSVWQKVRACGAISGGTPGSSKFFELIPSNQTINIVFGSVGKIERSLRPISKLTRKKFVLYLLSRLTYTPYSKRRVTRVTGF